MTKEYIKIFAPAKINLYLHILNKLPNKYHMLDSLASFVDIGDIIEIKKTDKFSLKIIGEFANHFETTDQSSDRNSTNLITKAVYLLAEKINKKPNFQITLTKNLPLASGIGGGSSNAASTIWGLMEWWDIKPQAQYIKGLMLQLGADVPACFNCKPSRMQGLGDIIHDAPTMPEVPIVLVNNGQHCPTPKIYANYEEKFNNTLTLPESFLDIKDFTHFLEKQSNDLTNAAIKFCPNIRNVLSAIKSQDKQLLTRMSGSGATCFGLFDTFDQAKNAERSIKQQNPNWWVKSGWLNRPERY